LDGIVCGRGGRKKKRTLNRGERMIKGGRKGKKPGGVAGKEQVNRGDGREKKGGGCFESRKQGFGPIRDWRGPIAFHKGDPGEWSGGARSKGSVRC